MPPVIQTLELQNFRNYESYKAAFGAPGTVLTGPNGSGKTNLLEAISFLSILRSFRNVSAREMVRIGERSFDIKGVLRKGNFPEELHVIESVSGKRETFIGPNRIRRSSEFIREFRTVVFVPEDRNIPAGSSLFRRRFFDMFISSVDAAYLTDLSAYAKALSQRNKALKSPAQEKIIGAFEPEMALRAPRIAAARRVYARLVENEVNKLLRKHGQLKFSIRYRNDFPENEEEYLSKLAANRKYEMLRGCTRNGPQLDEFEFYLNGKSVRSYASTGQIRILALLLKLAEFNLVRQHCDQQVIVLADDVTGELDAFNRDRFFDIVSDASQQFFTFTDFPEYPKLADFAELSVTG